MLCPMHLVGAGEPISPSGTRSVRRCCAYLTNGVHMTVSRLCQCSVSFCHGPKRRLYSSLCGPGHASSTPPGQILAYPNARFFQWDDILQVIIPRSSAMSAAAGGNQDTSQGCCPICLSPQVSPRMTKCGHVCPQLIFAPTTLIRPIGVLFPLHITLPGNVRKQLAQMSHLF